MLGEAVRSLRRQATPLKVHIATSPALAQLWLAPRLLRVRELLHDVDISVTTLEGPPDLKRGPFDLCLFYTANPEPHQIRLCDEDVFPVCTPALARRLQRPSDLALVTCIADVVWEDWKIWSAAAMRAGVCSPSGTQLLPICPCGAGSFVGIRRSHGTTIVGRAVYHKRCPGITV